MRVALFGGTFDPPHMGHVAIARAAADRFELDRVLFAPVGRQPLKRDRPVACYAERMAMTELACREDRRFAVSDLDAPAADGSPNYTVKTLAVLAERMPEARRFILVGADSFRGLAQWREPERLQALAEWIVVSRPGCALRMPDGLVLTPAQEARVHLLDTVHMDVAATDVRARLVVGKGFDEALSDLLPEGVAAYIHEHRLYRDNASGPGC